eukprot:jgi/Ulvmu1/271/UM001_0275.1
MQSKHQSHRTRFRGRVLSSSSKASRRHAPRCQVDTNLPGSLSRLSASQIATSWDSFEVQGFGYNEVVTRPCRLSDAYPAADVHVAAFYPKSGIFKLGLRFDRILSLIIGEKLDHKADQGRCFICFVADARPQKAQTKLVSSPTTLSHSTVPQVMLRGLLRVLGGEDALDWWGIPHTERGILGAVVFDTLGFHIPGLWSAETGWERRRNVGYISNLAVAPGARRQGIARRLVRRCEAVALADEKIEAMALHVGGENGGGRRLYEACGYELVTGESEWKALLGLNEAGTGLDLMVKRLRPSVQSVAGGAPPSAAPSDA